MMTKTKPNFLCIGVQKGGTSLFKSTSRYLYAF